VPVMEGEGDRYRIGELARLSGLSVKTIRFYSDRGLVPPAERTGAGYRVYDERALARLELIRALRELGASLADVERVLSREIDVPELVALQLEAVEAQLRVLRVRRAVLMAVASGEPDGQELRTMTRLAHISDDERKRIVEQFLDEVLGELEIDPGLEARLRGGLPELPDDPTPEQVEAWVELAELVRDPDFRARIRQMAESGAAERERGEAPDGEQRARQPPWWPSAEGPPWRPGSSRARRRRRRSWRRSSQPLGRRSGERSSRNASTRAPIRALSATGSCSP
jgi:DNA-binding transcriptional MerR regulator